MYCYLEFVLKVKEKDKALACSRLSVGDMIEKAGGWKAGLVDEKERSCPLLFSLVSPLVARPRFPAIVPIGTESLEQAIWASIRD